MTTNQDRANHGGGGFLIAVQGESRSAYPNWLGSAEDSEPGIDRLDYFAARAPKEPLWNFPVVGLPPRPKVVLPADRDPNGEGIVEGVMPLDEWENMRAVYRLAQWPWVWARAVLRAERIIDQADDSESLRQQAAAWGSVVRTLNSLAPHWNGLAPTGEQAAVKAIWELVTEANRQREIAARERGLNAVEVDRLNKENATLRAEVVRLTAERVGAKEGGAA